jgi:hypothetical protein
MKTTAFKVLGVNLLVFLGLLLVFEAVGQTIAVLRPSYDVLFLQPDRLLGWRQVPDLRWTWTGHYWYAVDFSVPVRTNQQGFRDVPRDFAKPPGVTRLAVLGDSFIEAVQVPLEKAATQILERRLNAPPDSASAPPRRWEVLNFGISNYGVGQYLLTWERYASRYKPDYVAIFVAKLHMQRTVTRYEYAAFRATRRDSLWIRPTFRLENDSLIQEPARDFAAFVRAQGELNRAEFSGTRIRRKPPRLLTLFYARQFWDALAQKAGRLARRIHPRPDQDAVALTTERSNCESLLPVNLRIVEELGRRVRDTGGTLVVVDVSRYFSDDEVISTALKACCARNDFGYIPLSEALLAAGRNGIPTSWPHDGHFNERGNAILAGCLYDWISQRPPARGRD